MAHTRISITIDEGLLAFLDEQVKKKRCGNRSQAIEHYVTIGKENDK